MLKSDDTLAGATPIVTGQKTRLGPDDARGGRSHSDLCTGGAILRGPKQRPLAVCIDQAFFKLDTSIPTVLAKGGTAESSDPPAEGPTRDRECAACELVEPLYSGRNVIAL